MEIRDLNLIGIEETEHVLLYCEICNNYSNSSLWRETEVYCGYCGTHGAFECPICKEDYDIIIGGEMQYKKIENGANNS